MTKILTNIVENKHFDRVEYRGLRICHPGGVRAEVTVFWRRDLELSVRLGLEDNWDPEKISLSRNFPPSAIPEFAIAGSYLMVNSHRNYHMMIEDAIINVITDYEGSTLVLSAEGEYLVARLGIDKLAWVGLIPLKKVAHLFEVLPQV